MRHTGAPAIVPLTQPRSHSSGELTPGVAKAREESEGDVPHAETAEDDKTLASEGSLSTDSDSSTEEDATSQDSEDMSTSDEVDGEDEGRKGSADGPRKKSQSDVSSGKAKEGRNGEGDDVDDGQPSFVYQRRKFILKHADGGGGQGQEFDTRAAAGKHATFGLVDLPVAYPLRR